MRHVHRHGRDGQASPTKDAAQSASAVQHQYQDVGDTQHLADAAMTSQNKYEPLQQHYLHLPELRNAIAPYCQLTSPENGRK